MYTVQELKLFIVSHLLLFKARFIGKRNTQLQSLVQHWIFQNEFLCNFAYLESREKEKIKSVDRKTICAII